MFCKLVQQFEFSTVLVMQMYSIILANTYLIHRSLFQDYVYMYIVLQWFKQPVLFCLSYSDGDVQGAKEEQCQLGSQTGTGGPRELCVDGHTVNRTWIANWDWWTQRTLC